MLDRVRTYGPAPDGFDFMDCIGSTQGHLFDLSAASARDARAIPAPGEEVGRQITQTTILTPSIVSVLWEHFDEDD